MISVIVPAYNEAAGLAAFLRAVEPPLASTGQEYELLFIDDGSSDATWSVIASLEAEHAAGAVRGIRFSRNFGKEAAILAGLAESRGDCAVVMDADLQHPPEKIPEMVALWQQGFEAVEGIKEDRGRESAMYRGFSRFFYSLMTRATGLDMQNSSDYKLLDRKVIDAINAMPERHTFFRALSFWAGFRRTHVTYRVQERQFGTSKWSKFGLVRYAIRNITNFSVLPMQLVTLMGAVLFVVSVIMSVIALVQKISGRALGGFTTVILLLMFSSSIIMFSLGIIGFYIAQIYEEVKRRPRYLIAERKEE